MGETQRNPGEDQMWADWRLKAKSGLYLYSSWSVRAFLLFTEWVGQTKDT